MNSGRRSESRLTAVTKDLVCGVDTGGTFTDCVILRSDGAIVPAKASSTPENFSIGVFDSVTRAAKALNLSIGEVLSRTSRFVVGTTVGTNAFLERKGAKVGVIATKGFEDTLFIMKGTGRSKGIAPRDIMRLEIAQKPAPLAPRRMIRGVVERVDSDGELLIPVDVEAVTKAADDLVAAGAESIAILFLWAFRNSENERKARDAIAARYRSVYLSCSHEIAPKIGEYERFTATVVNAYIGPVADSPCQFDRPEMQKRGLRSAAPHHGMQWRRDVERARRSPRVGDPEFGPGRRRYGVSDLGADLEHPQRDHRRCWRHELRRRHHPRGRDPAGG